jgi:hypothetical protein
VKADTARRVSLYEIAKQSRDATHQKFIDAGNKIKSSKKVFVSNSSKKKKKIADKPDTVNSLAVATNDEKPAQPTVPFDATSMDISNGHANESFTIPSCAHVQANHVDQKSFDAEPKTEANNAVAATSMEVDDS